MKNVQDIYPVSPMQEIMLLHALAQKNADTLFNQFCYQIDAQLDVAAFKSAWCRIIERHDALRTAFIWQGIKQPQQIVRKSSTPSFSEFDWRALQDSEIEAQFANFLARDREEGFDLRRAPLMRFSVMRIRDSSWRFIWSSHHLIVDRWCIGQLFAELDRYYAERLHHEVASEQPTAPSFRDYIHWIQRQDRESALVFWQTNLRGFSRPSSILACSANERTDESDSRPAETLEVSKSTVCELGEFVRKHGLTSSAVIQGAWALTLNRIAQTQDALFGATVAGRPPEILNVESIVGSFINNMPVRVLMPIDIGVLDWLAGIQSTQFDRTEFEYMSPSDVQSCSGVADADSLFDTLLVWSSSDDRPSGLPMRALASEFETAYPLTLSIRESSKSMVFHADCRGDCVMPLSDLLHEFEASLCLLLKAEDGARLGDLPAFHRDASFTGLPIGPQYCGARESTEELADTKPIDGAVRGRERLGVDVLQELLREEWSIVLGTPDLHPDADFFELGGTSLQAVRLHARIEKSTRQSLPLLTLFREPTINAMAQTLFDEDWPMLADLAIGLRTTCKGTPLFCIASPEVNTVGYSLLTRHLPDSQDVYVLQEPPDTSRVQHLDPSALPIIAGRYLESIRQIQPAGPYRLLAMCAGSHISMEITRRLEADNETIDFFGIINTWSLYTVTRLYHLNRIINISCYYAGRLRAFLPQRVATAATVAAGTTPHLTAAQESPALPAETDVGSRNPWIKDVGFEHSDPRRPKIATPVTVFRIKPQVFWRIRDEGLGWSKQATSVSVVYLSCDDHDAIMRKQHIRQLADSIEARLEECDGTNLPYRSRRSVPKEGKCYATD